MLRLAARLSKYLDSAQPAQSRTRQSRTRRRVACEALEPRELLSGPGSDFTLMGGQWNNAETITYSFPPDGVAWDTGTNNLNASLNAEYGGTGWQSLVAKALQTWAAVTNLNFTQVSDGPYGFNVAGVNQDDPNLAISGSAAITSAPRRPLPRPTARPPMARPAPAMSSSTPASTSRPDRITIWNRSSSTSWATRSAWGSPPSRPPSCTAIMRALVSRFPPTTSRAFSISMARGRPTSIRRKGWPHPPRRL